VTAAGEVGLKSPQAWPLTGRAEEIGLITDVLTGQDPHTGIAIIGPAGVGKSRLLREAAAVAARNGWVVRNAVATQSAQTIPLGAFAEWACDTDTRPLQAVSAVIDRLTTTTRGRPVLLTVDDAHRLDDISAFLLHQLVVRRLARCIVTVRSGEVAADAVTSLWKDEHLRLLPLQPLSRSESEVLLAEALRGPLEPQACERMWRLTNGNVLQLRHLVDQEVAAGRLTRQDEQWRWTGGPDISSALVDLIEAQVGAVPDAVLEVMDVMAVAEPMSLTMLSSMVDGAAVEEAERRGLLTLMPGTSGDMTVRVGHPLYGEIRRGRAGAARLRRLRGRVAEALAGTAGLDDNDLLRAGALWLESDLPVNSALLLKAAHVAFHRFDLSLAELLSAAVDSPSAVLLRSQALGLMNRGDEADQVLDAIDLDAVDDHQAGAATALRIGTLWGPLNRPDEALATLQRALADCRPAVAAAARSLNCYTLATAGRPLDALAQAQAISDAGSGRFVEANLFAGQVIALGDAGRIAEAQPFAEEAYRLAEQHVDTAFLGIGMTEHHVRALILAGVIPEAVNLASRVAEQCAEAPGGVGAMAGGIVGMAQLGAGHLSAARESLDAMADALRAQPAVAKLRSRFAIPHLEVLARLGAVDAAEVVAAELCLPLHPELIMLEPARLVALAWLDAARGVVSKAVAGARQAAEIASTRGQYAREVMALQVATHFGGSDTATRLSELCEIVSGPRVEVAATFAHALAAADGAALRTASDEFEAMGDVLAAADAAAHAAIAYRREGLRGSASTAAARAQRLAETCGGAVTPALSEAYQPLPLTAREREIIRLVGRGMSNRRIADELCMSVRTVEGHLYRASQRAGTNSREELVALLG
jgi:DNA-binding CsgD family transcriptional regulator